MSERIEMSKGFVEEALLELDKLEIPEDNPLRSALNGMLAIHNQKLSERKRTVALGTFNMTKKNMDLIFSHRSGDFTLRMFAAAAVDQVFADFSNPEVKPAMEVILAGMKLFCVRALQDYTFFHEYLMWCNERDATPVELTKEQDDQILKEEKEIYENNQKIKENE